MDSLTWPTPRPGLVIRYSYLWAQQADAGREEGSKDRPCAVILVLSEPSDKAPLVAVLPVTHTRPLDPSTAVEIPAMTKARLGLDGERSWIVLSEGNEFRWPGPDVRPSINGDPSSIVIGPLPPALFSQLMSKWRALAKARKVYLVHRTE